MRYRLYRNARHLRVEGIGESIRRKLSVALSAPGRSIARHIVIPLATTLGITVGTAGTALAEEPQITNTTTPDAMEQTVDASELAPVDDTIVSAVEQSQAMTDATQASTAAPVQTEQTSQEATSVETTPVVTEETINQDNLMSTPVTENGENTSIVDTQPLETEITQNQTDLSVKEEANSASSVAETTTTEVANSTQETSSMNEKNIVSENQTFDEQLENVRQTADVSYQVISQDGSLTIVGNVSEDQLSQVIEELTNQYGEEAISGLTIFDYETINSQIKTGETVQLGNSGYTAYKDVDGNIIIKNTDGEIVYNWEANEEVKDVEQVVENQMDDSQQGSQNITVPEDFESKEFDVEPNEFIVTSDSNGDYYFGLGGVGLSNAQFQDLLAQLQKDGIVPADVDYTLFVLPSAPTEEMINAGMTERILKVSDKLYVGMDINGKIIFHSSDRAILDNTLEYVNEQLEENHETSKDPNAETGNKADGDEPGNEIPEEKPEQPEEPTPEPEPEPTPEPQPEPTPEKTSQTSNSDIPQTGDSTIAYAGIGVAGATLAGAGATYRKRKNKKDDKGSRNLSLIDGGKPKITYEDLENMAKEGKQINPHDYDDDLELFAKAWVLSEEQKEQVKPKGRIH